MEGEASERRSALTSARSGSLRLSPTAEATASGVLALVEGRVACRWHLAVEEEPGARAAPALGDDLRVVARRFSGAAQIVPGGTSVRGVPPERSVRALAEEPVLLKGERLVGVVSDHDDRAAGEQRADGDDEPTRPPSPRPRIE